MNTSAWLDRRLAPISDLSAGLGIILDPDRIIYPESFPRQMVVVQDWWALRIAYERHVRRRPAEAGPLVMGVSGPLASQALPWDIEEASAAVLSMRLPGPRLVRAVLAGLEGEEADRAIAAVESSSDPARALLAAVAGMELKNLPTAVDQLRLAARLALRPDAPSALLELARELVVDRVLIGLLMTPPDLSALETAWEEFASGGESSWADTFRACRVELGQLFGAGLLRPVVGVEALPPWAAVGTRSLSTEERAEALLANLATPFPPVDAVGWVEMAVWWGDLRRLVAAAEPDLTARAWAVWAEIDAWFLPWLREHYAGVLSSAARWPPAVHRVAHHLARRLRDDQAARVLLIVLDGLGHAQWAHLRERAGIRVMEAGSTFALVPTYTTVSRQAIFAGELPVTYPDTLWTTQAEPRRWQAFWVGQGLVVTAVAYYRVRGHFPQDRIEFGAARAVGVVVNAVDDFMHGSELLGDAQLLANLDAWVENGFLQDLVRRGHDQGFEVWLTADHGNLECLPAGSPAEGLGIEAAGKRLRRYPNSALREASSAVGITWDDIPGLPASTEPLLFAPGRLAYTNQRLSVSHGGLSLDEVIVPLVRVAI